MAHSDTCNSCGLEVMHALGHFGNREGLHRRRGMPHSVGDYVIMSVTLPGTHRACLCCRTPHPHTARHPLMPTDSLLHKLAGLQHSTAPHSEMSAATRQLALAYPEAPPALGAHGPAPKPRCPWPHLLQQISSGSAWPGRCCWNWGAGGAATGTAASGVRTSPDSATDDNSASSFCRN